MTQMRKLHDIESKDKKIWAVLKNILFFFSIGILIYWGYLKSNNENPVNNQSFDPVEQNISEENQKNDSIYYAFSKMQSEHSRGKR